MREELDGLDRICAEAMGLARNGLGEPVGVGREQMPSPTRSPADFVALLGFHEKGGRWVELTFMPYRSGPKWECNIGQVDESLPADAPQDFGCGFAMTAMEALARATAAWHKN